MMPYYYHQGFGAGGAIFGGILMLIIWVAIITVVIWVIRSAMWRNSGRHLHDHSPMPRPDGGPTKPTPSNAVEILKTRFAKGEITKEQFEEMKKILEQ